MAACLLLAGVAAANDSVISGVVRDPQGSAVPQADLSLLDAGQVVRGTGKSDALGRFRFSGVPTGHYILTVKSPGFAERRLAVQVRDASPQTLDISLEVLPLRETVTVTAHAGVVEDVDAVAQPVNVISEDSLRQRAKAVVAQVAQEETGVALQRTSPTMAGIFVRGLTGDKVNVFIDGFRYTNSAQRGGVNTFLDLIEPSSLQTVEILRGPSSAQYGSEAIGGSVQFISRAALFSADEPNVHGEYSTSFNSADVSWGSTLSATFATRTFAVLANLAGRRSSRLRTGQGLDSHSALTRFLGLPSDVIGDSRLPDTAFTHYGGLLRINWALNADSQLVFHYKRGQQDGGKRYDQLLGGDGNLVADLRNLMLDFFYVRYEKVKLRWFDSLSLGYSLNSQREKRVNQGGNGNPSATISHEYERTTTHGVNGYLNKQSGTRNAFLVGGDYYRDAMNSPSFGFNPVTLATALRRPRVPDNARYLSGGFYVQDIFDIVPKKLRLVGNMRYSGAAYRARVTDSPLVGGSPLWPDDSLAVHAATYRAGLVTLPVRGFSFSAKISRGLRAPLMTDLGTLGLTGAGFEVASADLAGRNATIGSTADAAAISTGLAVQQLGPESSLTYEFGLHYRNSRMDTDFAFFINDIHDLIAKQTLILPAGAVGQMLGSEVITAQNANGAVFVAASTNPALVRANFGDARIRGVEHRLNLKVSRDWALATVFTYLRAHDRDTGLAPNIEGGTPAPDGYLRVRYAPGKYRFWVEPYLHAAGRQERLSTLDLSDRRTGATRSRNSIGNFFLNGATARGLIGAGTDTMFGTADDVLLLTGETLVQVQDRVLGVGVNSAPLFTAVPGYFTAGVRGGWNITERHSFTADFENIGGRNYRGISWGLDAPGRSLAFRYNVKF